MPDRRERSRPTPDGRLDAEEVAFRRREIVSLLVELSVRFDDALAGQAPTNNSEITALIALRLVGPQRAFELGDLTRMTRAGTTNMIDRLEAAGLVRRTSIETDHRGVLVELTSAGREVTAVIADRVTHVVLDAAPLIAAVGEHLLALGYDIGPLQLPAGSVEQRLSWFSRVVSSGEQAQVMYLAAFGVPTGRLPLHLLLLATEPGGTRPSAVATAMRLSSATVSDLLARAEHDGLITRTTGRRPDRRVTVVEATDRGRKALDDALNALDPALRTFAASLFPT